MGHSLHGNKCSTPHLHGFILVVAQGDLIAFLDRHRPGADEVSLNALADDVERISDIQAQALTLSAEAALKVPGGGLL